MFRKSFHLTVILYFFLLGTILICMGYHGLNSNERSRETERKRVEIWLKTLSKESARQTTPITNKRMLQHCMTLKMVNAFTKEGPEMAKEEQGEGRSQPKAPLNDNEGERILPYSEDEIRVLERIIEAEAGGEDADGKLLVANVVLNRVKDESFPNTITEVVFQKSNGVTQFSPVANGRYEAVTVSQESKDAAQRALRGEDLSDGALYFAARKHANPKSMQWFDQNLTLLFQHGGHEFFK